MSLTISGAITADAERARRITRKLAEITQILAATPGLAAVSQGIVDAAHELFGARYAALFDVDGTTHAATVIAVAGGPVDVLMPGFRLASGVGAVGLAVGMRAAVVTADVLADPRIVFPDDLRGTLAAAPYRAVLVTPLITRGVVVGALAVCDRRDRVFSADDVALGGAFSDHAVVGFEIARLFDESERRRREAETLASLTRSLSEDLDVERAGRRVVDAARRLLDVEAAALYRMDAGTGTLRVAVESMHGDDTAAWFPELAVSEGVVGRAAAEGRTIASTDVLHDRTLTYRADARAFIEARGYRALLAVPLGTASATLGVLAVADRRGRSFSPDALHLAHAFADQVALAIHNAELFTREQAARRAAETSEQRYRELFDNVPVGLYRAAPDGTILAANRTLATMLGYPDGASLHGRKAVDMCVDPHDPARWREVAASRTHVHHFDARARRRDGSIVPVRLSAHAIRDEAGRIGSYEGTLEDMTEARTAEAARSRTEAQFRTALDNVPFDFWIADADGRYVFLNAAAAARWRHRIGDRLEDRDDLPKDVVERWLQSRARAYAGDVVQGEAVYVIDGRPRTYYRVVSPVRVDGRVVGISGVRMDITAGKDTERALRESEEQVRQLQKMEALGRLAAGVAHDFNNLLTVIGGRAELLLRRETRDPAVLTNVGLIRETTRRAAELTRQLLAFSRKQVLEPRVLSLNDTVAGVEKILRRLIGEDVELTIRLTPDAGHVQADPAQLEQVIFNLVVNSRDAMPGGGKLVIRTGSVVVDGVLTRQLALTHGPHAVLTVEDTGCGMDAATRERVFEPFFTTKAPDRGTGLGLSAVFGVVRQSGGDIHVYSELGIGTTFTIYLPQVAADAATDGEAPAAAGRTGTETILVAEDDEAVLGVAVEILQEAGYSVLAAANGAEALAIAERRPVDLLLTDVIMPGMSGGELAARFVERHPAARVLLASGYTADVLDHHGLLALRAALLHKPYSMESLLRMVRDVLDAPRPA